MGGDGVGEVGSSGFFVCHCLFVFCCDEGRGLPACVNTNTGKGSSLG